MHALRAFLPQTLCLCAIGFYLSRLIPTDGLPQFYRPAAACFHLIKSSLISAPNQFLQRLFSRPVRTQSVWDQVPTLFASATPSQPHPVDKQIQ
jgi:hypothetical protein